MCSTQPQSLSCKRSADEALLPVISRSSDEAETQTSPVDGSDADQPSGEMCPVGSQLVAEGEKPEDQASAQEQHANVKDEPVASTGNTEPSNRMEASGRTGGLESESKGNRTKETTATDQPTEGVEASEGDMEGTSVRTAKKPRLVWTAELHSRFMSAVNHLGVKNAVPTTILKLMNVEGMTRENVASHLQKYRLYLKRMAGLPPGARLPPDFMVFQGPSHHGALHANSSVGGAGPMYMQPASYNGSHPTMVVSGAPAGYPTSSAMYPGTIAMRPTAAMASTSPIQQASCLPRMVMTTASPSAMHTMLSGSSQFASFSPGTSPPTHRPHSMALNSLHPGSTAVGIPVSSGPVVPGYPPGSVPMATGASPLQPRPPSMAMPHSPYSMGISPVQSYPPGSWAHVATSMGYRPSTGPGSTIPIGVPAGGSMVAQSSSMQPAFGHQQTSMWNPMSSHGTVMGSPATSMAVPVGTLHHSVSMPQLPVTSTGHPAGQDANGNGQLSVLSLPPPHVMMGYAEQHSSWPMAATGASAPFVTLSDLEACPSGQGSQFADTTVSGTDDEGGTAATTIAENEEAALALPSHEEGGLDLEPTWPQEWEQDWKILG